MYIDGFLTDLRQFAESVKASPCDKCKLPVPPQNSVLVFDFINAFGTDWTLIPELSVNRHVEPVADEQGLKISGRNTPTTLTIIGLLVRLFGN